MRLEKQVRHPHKAYDEQATAVLPDVSDSLESDAGNGRRPRHPGFPYKGDLDVYPAGVSDFEPETLIHVFRTMLLSRRLDEKMLSMFKQGKGFFHIGAAGHEAT